MKKNEMAVFKLKVYVSYAFSCKYKLLGIPSLVLYVVGNSACMQTINIVSKRRSHFIGNDGGKIIYQM